MRLNDALLELVDNAVLEELSDILVPDIVRGIDKAVVFLKRVGVLR